MRLQWRKLDFFEKRDWKDLKDDQPHPLSDFQVHSCSAGNGYLVFGSKDGIIRVLRNNHQITEFQSHNLSIEYIVKSQHDAKVLILGRDKQQGKEHATMKIWNLSLHGAAREVLRVNVFNQRDFPEEAKESRTLDKIFDGVMAFDSGTFFRILQKGGVKITREEAIEVFKCIPDIPSNNVDIMDLRIKLQSRVPQMKLLRQRLFDAGVIYSMKLFAVKGFQRGELTDDLFERLTSKVFNNALFCGVQNNQIVIDFGDEYMTPERIQAYEDEIRDLTRSGHLRLEEKNYENNKNPITCISTTRDFSKIALGFASGAVALYEHGGASYSLRLLRPKGERVTGLQFIHDDAIKQHFLYLVDIDRVRCYPIFPNSTDFLALDDNSGAEGVNCTAVNADNILLLARESRVDFFHVDHSEGCDVFDGENKLIRTFRDYIVLCSQPNRGMYDSSLADQKRWDVRIYGRKNGKFVAYRGTHVGVIDVVCDETWKSVFLVCEPRKNETHSKLVQLAEKPTEKKLEWLLRDGRFRKERYQRAFAVAEAEGCDDAVIHDIHRKYADQLYTRGEFEAAMDEYVKTIGSDRVEPSYVIQKYLDGQKIKSLTKYLEALHDHEGATSNPDHTTLLLNCYTKEKNHKKLSDFIRGGDETKFSIKTAIRVCRQAGLYENALYLAKQHEKHDDFLDMLLEQARNEKDESVKADLHADALKYVEGLDFANKVESLKAHGKKFMKYVPEETTQLLIQVCTVKSSKQDSAGGLQIIKSAVSDDFIHLFVDHQDYLLRFLEEVKEKDVKQSEDTYLTLLELYLRQYREAEDAGNIPAQKGAGKAIMSLVKSNRTKFDPSQALLLAKMYGMELAVIYLYKELRLHEEIIQHYRNSDLGDKKNAKQIIKHCKENNKNNPQLWVRALTYFAQQDGCEEQIFQVLSRIQEQNLIPPLRVVQILAQNPNLQLSVVKKYLIEVLTKQQKMIEEDERDISKFRTEIKEMKDKIYDIRHNAQQFQNAKCDLTQLPLELPAVHYLCGHSFTKSSQADGEEICPICAPKYERVQEMQNRMKNQDGDMLDENFFKQIRVVSDPFNKIAEYFGRGVLNQTVERTT